MTQFNLPGKANKKTIISLLTLGLILLAGIFLGTKLIARYQTSQKAQAGKQLESIRLTPQTSNISLSKKKVPVASFKINEPIKFRLTLPKKLSRSLLLPLGVKSANAQEQSTYQSGDLTVSATVILAAPPAHPKADVNIQFTPTSNGEIDITVLPEDPRSFRGSQYQLQADITKSGESRKITHDFTWGVLTVNTNKSIFTPGETVYLQMASLNEYGKTLCGSNLKLEITDPAGKTAAPEIQKSNTCGADNVTDNPDYFTYYDVQTIGNYHIKLTNTDNNYNIDDSFEVKESVPFVVERIGATRINPYKSAYTMNIKVTANQDFSGAVEEQVPDDFEIKNSNIENSLKTENLKLKIISWPVTLLKGQTTTLSYTYQAPKISPEIFLLGPMQFVSSQSAASISQQKTTLADGSLISGSTDSGNSSPSSNYNLPQNTKNVKSGGKGNRTPGTMLEGLAPRPATPTPSSLLQKLLALAINPVKPVYAADNNPTIVFSESRSWSLASDAVFTCTATVGGNFDAAGSWTNCNSTYPQTGDTAVICNGKTITMVNATSYTVAALTIGDNVSCTGGGGAGTLNWQSGGGTGSLTVTNATTMSNGQTGTLDMTNGGTLTTSTFVNAGSSSTKPVLTAGSGTIVVTGTGTLISATNSTSWNAYNNLTVNGSGVTVSLGQAITAKNITVTAGTLNTTASNYNITLSGNWTNSGTFTPNSGTVAFQSMASGNTINPGSSSFYNVTFDQISRWVTVGNGTNSLAYSSDGLTWTGLGTTMFAIGYGVAWNGTRWVAGGSQATTPNSQAYSSDGITWSGLGTAMFVTGTGVAWNGTRWVAGGAGTSTPNTLAYSSDGLTWTGLGTSSGGNTIFSTQVNSIAWNGTRWVAAGSGTNSLAYSSDGIVWTPLGTSIFGGNTPSGYGIAWNGTRWVAGGNVSITGSNSLAYSSDGITWSSLGKTIFSTAGKGIAWNGTRWVATGQGNTNSLAYSSDGIAWSGLGTSIFAVAGFGVAWNGTRWVGGGQATSNNTLAYSSDGIAWSGLGTTIFATDSRGPAPIPAPQLTPTLSAGWTFGSNSATVTGNFTINSGAVTAPSTTLTIQGNFTNNDTFTHNSGTVTFNGSNAQTLSGSATTTFYNLTITGNRTVTVNGGTTLAVGASGTLTLTGGGDTSSLLTIQSDGAVDWNLHVSTTSPTFSISDVKVSHSNAGPAGTYQQIDASNGTNTNNGNNTNWNFGTRDYLRFSGLKLQGVRIK